MNDRALDDLFRAAKACPPDTSRAEFALETRVVARIRAAGVEEDWLVWARKLLPLAGMAAAACAIWALADPPGAAEEAVPDALAAAVWEGLP